MEHKISHKQAYLIVVLLVALVAAGLTWYFVDKANKQEKRDLEAQINDLKADDTAEASSETETAEEVDETETTGWQVYESNKGFSIRYPDQWDLNKTIEEKDTLADAIKSGANYFSLSNLYQICKNDQQCKDGFPGEGLSQDKWAKISVAIEINDNKSIEDWANNYFKDQKVNLKLSDFDIAGMDAKKVLVTYTEDEAYQKAGDSYVVIFAKSEKDNHRVIFSIGPKQNSLFDQAFRIIQTFKFDETLTWQSYKDKNYNLSFKYPKDWSIVETSFNKANASEDAPFWEKIDVSNIQIDLGKNQAKGGYDTVSKLSAWLNITEIGNLRKFSDTISQDVDVLLKIYNNKSMGDNKKALWLPPSNAALLAYSSPEYFQTSDGNYRGMVYFGNFGQDIGTSLETMVIITNGKYVFQMKVADNTSKGSEYSLNVSDPMPVAEKYQKYVKTLSTKSTGEQAIDDYNSIYKYVADSVR